VSDDRAEIERLRREIHRAPMCGAELLDAARAMCDALEPTADDLLPSEHRVLLARLRAAAGPDPEAERALEESLRRRRDRHPPEVRR